MRVLSFPGVLRLCTRESCEQLRGRHIPSRSVARSTQRVQRETSVLLAPSGSGSQKGCSLFFFRISWCLRSKSISNSDIDFSKDLSTHTHGVLCKVSTGWFQPCVVGKEACCLHDVHRESSRAFLHGSVERAQKSTQSSTQQVVSELTHNSSLRLKTDIRSCGVRR